MPVSHFPTDPDENAASIINLAEVIFTCLEAIDASSVIEVGAFHGKSTRELLGWAEGRDVAVVAVDTQPAPALRELAETHPGLELIETTSHEALASRELADAVILDGDHNHYTLSEELRIISERAAGSHLPLLILHDIGWPLARRDAYYAPDRIPAERRQPLAHDVYLVPGQSEPVSGGMPFSCVARREGGPANGVLTAVEDFVGDRDDLQLAIVPAFFGLGFLWSREAQWASRVAETLAPWDRNPVLARLEANRVRQMTERYRITRLLDDLEARGERREAQLRRVLGTRGLALARRVAQRRRRAR